MHRGNEPRVSSRFARFAVKLRACRPFALIAASVADGGFVARVNGHVGAGIGQRERHRRAEAARRARDERNLPRQIEQLLTSGVSAFRSDRLASESPRAAA